MSCLKDKCFAEGVNLLSWRPSSKSQEPGSDAMSSRLCFWEGSLGLSVISDSPTRLARSLAVKSVTARPTHILASLLLWYRILCRRKRKGNRISLPWCSLSCYRMRKYSCLHVSSPVNPATCSTPSPWSLWLCADGREGIQDLSHDLSLSGVHSPGQGIKT